MQRPEHATLSIIDDLKQAQHKVLQALEHSTELRDTRDLKVAYTNLCILTNQMHDGKPVQETARAFTETALALVSRIGGQR